jgi:AcrR family transcriptional regulator
MKKRSSRAPHEPRPSKLRAAPAREVAKRAGPRARRGSPDETRSRLVAAAAQEIEKVGYFATDSNRIARAAGYAPGTFYKHFPDKLAVFLAVYDQWIDREWETVFAIVEAAPTPRAKAEQIVDHVIGHHKAWPGLRASLRALVAIEPEVKKARRASRRKQLETMERLGLRSSVDNAFLLLAVERTADALADGELRDLGVDEATARDALVAQIEAHIAPRKA